METDRLGGRGHPAAVHATFRPAGSGGGGLRRAAFWRAGNPGCGWRTGPRCWWAG
ncbi:MAG: hypothetical protein MZU95_15955 [Desulfomicrobium escambiense]|nr:hypothetical protein [Desulfomicrobium escambiense]